MSKVIRIAIKNEFNRVVFGMKNYVKWNAIIDHSNLSAKIYSAC